MKVYAGLRGSGKTYKLAHDCMKNERGVFVVNAYYMIRYIEREYPDLRGRVAHREGVDRLPQQVMLYIDEVRDGENLDWAQPREIGAIAVAVLPNEAVNPHLPASYTARLKDLYFPE